MDNKDSKPLYLVTGGTGYIAGATGLWLTHSALRKSTFFYVSSRPNSDIIREMPGHIIRMLLQDEKNVRTTARKLTQEKADKLRVLEPDRCVLVSNISCNFSQSFASYADEQLNLEIVQADLNNDEKAWRKVVKGCTHVFHVASPLPHSNPKGNTATRHDTIVYSLHSHHDGRRARSHPACRPWCSDGPTSVWC